MENNNDEIYVMADPNSSSVTPIPSQSKFAWITIGLLAGLIVISGGTLAYILMNKSAAKQQTSSQETVVKQGVKNPTKSKGYQSVEIGNQGMKQELIINFDLNNAELMPADISKIKSFWSKAKGSKGKMLIAGHTDDLGSEVYNQKLSQKRAQKVAGILQSLDRDNHYQVTIQGFGETNPIGRNSQAEGRALNRRAVISLSVQK